MEKIRYKIADCLTKPCKIRVFIYVILSSVVLNLTFSCFNNLIIKSPLFLDSIFTAAAAALLGPFAGVLTGFFTNAGMELVYGMTGLYWPFAVCNMATGLIVGYMSRKKYFENMIQITIAVFLVALTNAFLGAHVAYIFFEGDSGVVIDKVVSTLLNMGQTMFSAVFWARIPANLADKIITIIAAFCIHKWIFRSEADYEYFLTDK